MRTMIGSNGNVRRALYSGILMLAMTAGLVNVCRAESFLKTKVQKVGSSSSVNEGTRQDRFLRMLEVPADMGYIREVHVPQSPAGQLVINIQDLHCNYEAQQHISQLLDHLTKTYGLKLISVEGGSGKIDTTFYRELPDEKVKEQVADYFLREARINGTEYFAITTKRDIALYGAEEAEYYEKNLDAFLKALPDREKTLSDIRMLENALNILKNKIYNKKLKELDDFVVAYGNEELDFEAYVEYLAGLYPRDKIKREFSFIPQLLESFGLKKKIDLEKVEQERQELLDHLQKNLTTQDMSTFVRVSLEYKAHTIDELAYHNTIRELYAYMQIKAKTLDRAWPNLDKYIKYLNKHETIDERKMFDEIDVMVERIKDTMYTSYTQKKLDRCLNNVRMAHDLFGTKLLNRQLKYVKRYRGQFKSRKIKEFIEEESRRLKLDLPLPGDLSAMDENLPILEDFYRYASRRNEFLSGNTLDAMATEGEEIGILITGGFHTDGIKDILKEKRISYVVITPNVEKLDEDDTRYINALQGKKTPFEEQLEREEQLAKNGEEQQ